MASSRAADSGTPRGAADEIRPSLTLIFLIFGKISLTSFGGGLSGWMLREFVEKRRWFSEQDFLALLALSQSFPGANVVNLSVWIGYRLRGTAGALAGFLGIVAPAILAALVVVSAFDRFLHFQPVDAAVTGFAAAAIGLSLKVGARMAYRAANSAFPIIVMVTMFTCIAVLGLPLVPVVLVAAPISLAHAFMKPRWKFLQ